MPKNNSIKVRGFSYTVSNRNFNKYMEILTHGNVFMWITKRTRVSTDRRFWCTVYRDHVMRHTRHQPPKYPPLNPVKLRKLIYFKKKSLLNKKRMFVMKAIYKPKGGLGWRQDKRLCCLSFQADRVYSFHIRWPHILKWTFIIVIMITNDNYGFPFFNQKPVAADEVLLHSSA